MDADNPTAVFDEIYVSSTDDGFLILECRHGHWWSEHIRGTETFGRLRDLVYRHLLEQH